MKIKCEIIVDVVLNPDETKTIEEKTTEVVAEEKIEEAENGSEKEENGTANSVGPGLDYIKRGFTSEIFKVEIQNLPKHYGFGELKKLLTHKLKLEVSFKFEKIACLQANNHYSLSQDLQNQEPASWIEVFICLLPQ